MSGRAELGALWSTIQTWLFPMLEDELGELDDRHREFIAVCEVCALPEHGQELGTVVLLHLISPEMFAGKIPPPVVPIRMCDLHS
ncbi:MAG: hypothetical protein ABIF71_14800 [Planctomycetota bacterium]